MSTLERQRFLTVTVKVDFPCCGRPAFFAAQRMQRVEQYNRECKQCQRAYRVTRLTQFEQLTRRGDQFEWSSCTQGGTRSCTSSPS